MALLRQNILPNIYHFVKNGSTKAASLFLIAVYRLGMSVLCGILKNMQQIADCLNTKYAAEIGGNMVQNCLKPTTPSCSTGIWTHGCCYSVGNQMAEVMKPNRNR